MNDKGEGIVSPLCFPIPQFCAIMGYIMTHQPGSCWAKYFSLME